MKLSLLHRRASPASASPYRLVDHQGHEVTWANDFLDAQCIRHLSLRSLRAYGYDLLHFARWRLQHPSPTLLEIDESTLLEYVRDQLNESPKPTPQTPRVAFCLFSNRIFRSCTSSRSCAAIPTGLPGSAFYANNNRPCPMLRAKVICSISDVFSTTWHLSTFVIRFLQGLARVSAGSYC